MNQHAVQRSTQHMTLTHLYSTMCVMKPWMLNTYITQPSTCPGGLLPDVSSILKHTKTWARPPQTTTDNLSGNSSDWSGERD